MPRYGETLNHRFKPRAQHVTPQSVFQRILMQSYNVVFQKNLAVEKAMDLIGL